METDLMETRYGSKNRFTLVPGAISDLPVPLRRYRHSLTTLEVIVFDFQPPAIVCDINSSIAVFTSLFLPLLVLPDLVFALNAASV